MMMMMVMMMITTRSISITISLKHIGLRIEKKGKRKKDGKKGEEIGW